MRMFNLGMSMKYRPLNLKNNRSKLQYLGVTVFDLWILNKNDEEGENIHACSDSK